ncbi:MULTISPECIES: serine/threonine-protein kinase [unclassified Leifsonia]|uniref:serine/threonine-protein kinase n=1 Tax=unclassified Leifsonia TaxID=2663824 RepID=UPI0008A79BF4|nr:MULTISPECIES: serine/threonine-protein kinase [unclassified Leifsonia]SEH62322.1 serine/threonine protein kinase [Leifsonia sp. CL154]SFL17074.1 serine/threonine protein kinase [Leifsonia sp. CL147]
MRPTAGLTFGGRYELQSRIAIGGMGEVWQATDLVIGRTVAIKILKDEYLGDPGFLERFRAEARHAALVNHEGIANVYDYGEEDGSAYLVMELVPGEALSSILEREHILSTDRTLDIVAQTAAALHAAHAAGLVHRDIKPGNLLITPDGRVKITDFGIARIADQVPLTATGQVMGTVQYLSPEQASGHPASPTTDIYSLGIVAYECLAGRRPFTGESQVAIAMAQINEAPPELPATVAEPVRNLVFACIAKNPADRPASAAHLARAAQALRRGDVRAAAVAVPAILGAAVATDAATVLMSSPAGPTAATTVLPATAVAPMVTEEETVAPVEERKRSRWTWPLIALIALLALVLIGTLITLLAQPKPVPTPTPSDTPSHSASPSPTPSATPTSNTVQITEADFLGLTADQARAKLQSLGMVADVSQGTAATTQDQANKVYSVNPTGPVPKGATIGVKVYGPVAPVPTPTDTVSATPPSGQGAPNSQIAVSFGSATCPAGQNLIGRRLYVNGQPQTPVNDTKTTWTPTTMGTYQLTYTIFCGESVESGQSPALAYEVGGPTTPPSAGGSGGNK